MMGSGLAMLYLWPEPLGVFVSTIILAIGISFNYPSLMAMTVKAVPDRERVRAIATFTMFFDIGTATGATGVRNPRRPHHETLGVPRRSHVLHDRAGRVVEGRRAAIACPACLSDFR
jgi:hypothetical protein